MGVFALRETWMRIYFSVIRESIFFRSRETGFRFFRDPWNMHLLSRDFWTNDFWGNNFSLFLGILASLKLVNYAKLEVKPAHSMSLRIEDWELTTATATLRDWNLQSWTRVLGQICALGVFAHTSDANTTPPPLNIVLEGRERVTRF